MLHSVKCLGSFDQNLKEKETIPLNEVKDHFQNILSEFIGRQKHEIDQLKNTIYSQGKKIANLEKENSAHQKLISKLEIKVALLEVNRDYMDSNVGGSELNETDTENVVKLALENQFKIVEAIGNKNVKSGKFTSATL